MLYKSEYYAKNRQKRLEYAAKRRASGHEYNIRRTREKTKKGRIQACLTKAKCRKKEFNLSFEYLENLFDSQQGKCSISGVPLTFEGNTPNLASLDRIDSAKGYVEGNIQWVAWYINKMKQDLSMVDFLQKCKEVYEYRYGVPS